MSKLQDKLNSAKDKAAEKLTADQLKQKRSLAAKKAAETRKANKLKAQKAADQLGDKIKQETKAAVMPVNTEILNNELPFSTEMDNGLNWAIAYTTSNGYSGIPRPLFSALTIAALYVVGMLRFTNNGTVASTGKTLANLNLLSDITSTTMKRYFIDQAWIERNDKGFTLSETGINRLNDRLTSLTDRYAVTMQSILDVVECMVSSGTIAVGQTAFSFPRKIKLWIIE